MTMNIVDFIISETDRSANVRFTTVSASSLIVLTDNNRLECLFAALATSVNTEDSILANRGIGA